MFEETGLKSGQSFQKLAELIGYNNEQKETKGFIYLKIFRKSPYKIIKKHLKNENPRLREIGKNEIGELATVHRWRPFGWFVFFSWWNLTPQAVYALRDSFDRDPTSFGS